MPPGKGYRISTFVRDIGEANAAATALASLPPGRSADGRIVRFSAGVADQQSFITLDLQNVCRQFNEPVVREMNRTDRQTYDHLAGLRGERFDFAFVSAMLALHQRYSDILARGRTQLPDGEFRQFADRSMQPLQMSLAGVRMLDQQIGTAPDDITPNR